MKVIFGLECSCLLQFTVLSLRGFEQMVMQKNLLSSEGVWAYNKLFKSDSQRVAFLLCVALGV
ncbi:hypothetical protein THOG11_180006 [Vibrio harveyi]|nr:hypothetical protein TH15OA1_260159 [Vibrio harveyi]CAH1557665.1 hypothetical protein THOD03_210006 [Vibrio harveyi]CAH1559319.1 hypothetical protein THOG11_180006 [Vibrio harveyi]